MPRSRKNQTQHLKPWMKNAILANTEQTKAQTVKVWKHIDGPRTDGSIIREVTDGAVFIKAIFSTEALTEMFSEEGSTQPEWYSALLVLRKFTISFDVKNCFEQSEYVLQVESASIWDLQQGFYLKYQVTDCMEISDVRNLARELYESCQLSQNTNDMMDGSISLTQLMGNLSYIESQSQSDKNNKDCSSEMTDEFEMKEFIIPAEQQCILDNIEEWKPDYVPTIEDNSQQSPEKSEENVQKNKEKIDTEKKSKNIEVDERCSQQTKSTRDEAIISSGESIRLSCSDYSETDIQVHNHGDDLVHSESSRVSSSSGGDNSGTDKAIKANYLKSINLQSKSKTDKNSEKKRSDDYQKEFENFAMNDESVTSTVPCFGETQPFLPAISPTSQPFSPNRDEILSGIQNEILSLNDLVIDLEKCQSQETIETKKNERSCDTILHCKYYVSQTSGDQSVRNKSSCDTVSHGNLNSSDQSLIDDTPEDEMLKSVKTNSNKEIIHSRKHKNGGYMSNSVNDRQKCINISEVAEENRLNKLSDLSEELVSPEDLLQLLNKPSSSMEDNETMRSSTQESCNDLSQFPKSVSDKTLMEISSGLMKQTSDSQKVKISEINVGNDCLDHDDTQNPHYDNEKSVERFTQNNAKTMEDRNITIVKVKITNVQLQEDKNTDLELSSKSLKRNRSDSQETDRRTGKYKKSNSGVKLKADSESCDKKKLKNIDGDKILPEKTVNAELKSNVVSEAVELSEHDDLPDSESLLGQRLSSREKPLLEKNEDVIVISSGDSIDCEVSTGQNKDGGSHSEYNVKNNVYYNTEFAENRQRNPLTESEETKTSSNQSDSVQKPKRWFKFKNSKTSSTLAHERKTLSRDSSTESRLKVSESKSASHSKYLESSANKTDSSKSKTEIENIGNIYYPHTSTPENIVDIYIGDLHLSKTSDIQEHQVETKDQDDSIVSQEFPQNTVICKKPAGIQYSDKDKNTDGKQPKIPHTKMKEFLADIQPKTDIGKRLLAKTVPSDMALTAFNYYRNK